MSASTAESASASDFAQCVTQWQRLHGRHDLPWQGTRDPYRRWLSEVMLQQTQVSTVQPYYARFLARFPDVRSLATAPLDDVLAAWSGLGYYSRARNLHRCAQAVVQTHGGSFPRRSAELVKLPGIGRSTAAAIAAFCFDERAAILDGNVKRVLTRVLGFDGDLAVAAQERALWHEVEQLLPQRDMAGYTQGLMDLGATLCLARAPLCAQCPVARQCVARAQGQPQRYPVKTRKLKRHQRAHALLWLMQGERSWLVQRPATGVWAGLWSLPEWADVPALLADTSAWPGRCERLPEVAHVLTHVDWLLSPVRQVLPARIGAAHRHAINTALSTRGAGRWVTRDEALQLGLAAPIRRWMQALDRSAG